MITLGMTSTVDQRGIIGMYEIDDETMNYIFHELKIAQAVRENHWEAKRDEDDHYEQLRIDGSDTCLALEGLNRCRALRRKLEGMVYVKKASEYISDLSRGEPKILITDMIYEGVVAVIAEDKIRRGEGDYEPS